MDAERVARLEERVEGIKEDLIEIKGILGSQNKEHKKLADAVAKWKQGAGLIFALGAVGMWVIDHWTWVIGHFKS